MIRARTTGTKGEKPGATPSNLRVRHPHSTACPRATKTKVSGKEQRNPHRSQGSGEQQPKNQSEPQAQKRTTTTTQPPVRPTYAQADNKNPTTSPTHRRRNMEEQISQRHRNWPREVRTGRRQDGARAEENERGNRGYQGPARQTNPSKGNGNPATHLSEDQVHGGRDGTLETKTTKAEAPGRWNQSKRKSGRPGRAPGGLPRWLGPRCAKPHEPFGRLTA